MTGASLPMTAMAIRISRLSRRRHVAHLRALHFSRE
jgi:hypothetical protein